MSGDKQRAPVNPLLIVLVGALAAAALPWLGLLPTALILSLGLAIYGLLLWRGGQRVSAGLLLTAALAIVVAALLRR